MQFRRDDSRPRRTLVPLSVALIAVAAGTLYAAYEYKWREERWTAAIALTGGDPRRGPALIRRYGCAGCHTIPGVPGATGLVGPPLRNVAQRVYIGGVITNTPDNLMRWIANPQAIGPKTAMPVTGISPAEAKHVAAYLYASQ